jgi:hypothetical protein
MIQLFVNYFAQSLNGTIFLRSTISKDRDSEFEIVLFQLFHSIEFLLFSSIARVNIEEEIR